MHFTTAALADSLLDGIVLGGILAIILVTLRGPIVPAFAESQQRTKRRRKSPKPKRSSDAGAGRRPTLSDYLMAWAMVGLVAASASYAVAGGHGAYGIVTSATRALRAVREPLRLVMMAILNTIVIGGMGAIMWTGIWWIGMLLLRMLGPKWVERTKLIHGTVFGLVIGGLLGLSATLNEGMAGNIVNPIDLLF